MSTAFWLATGQTVVLVCAAAWAWWASRRIEDLIHNTTAAAEHAIAGAHHANRAALDVRQMLADVRGWLDEMRDWAAEPPQTEPLPTQPQAAAIGRIDDVELAWEVARLEQIMRGDVTTVPRKAAVRRSERVPAVQGPRTPDQPTKTAGRRTQ